MRSIGTRQFQQHFHSEIKNLPFVVTKNGDPLFVVTYPGNTVVTPDGSPIDYEEEIVEEKIAEEISYGFCTAPGGCRNPASGVYTVLAVSDEGQEELKVPLCNSHRQRSKEVL